jgi:hypothetical protein
MMTSEATAPFWHLWQYLVHEPTYAVHYVIMQTMMSTPRTTASGCKTAKMKPMMMNVDDG